jgi:hypothetical protein
MAMSFISVIFLGSFWWMYAIFGKPMPEWLIYGSMIGAGLFCVGGLCFLCQRAPALWQWGIGKWK